MGILPAVIYVSSLLIGAGIWLLIWRRLHRGASEKWTRRRISAVMFAIALVLIVVFSILDDVVLSQLS